MAYKPTVRSKGKPNAPRATEVFTVPAPIGGIDSRNLLGQGNPRNCIYAYNLVPDETGVRVRSGYREWSTGSDEVRTIIPFKATNPSDDRLFIATESGIYDATTYGVTPTAEVTWAETGADAGWGVFINYIGANDDSYCFYADSVNGLYRYSAVDGLWTVPTITGVAVGNVNFVTSHKLRIWLGAENDSKGYYLGIDAIGGAATAFNFGRGFKHGGNLKGLFSWTVDGGVGVDDYLVAVSSTGDVAPYTGSDPSELGWSISGSYYIGEMAKGGRCGSRQGGNLHLLSSYGLISMSDLLRGVDPLLPDAKSISAKIAPFLRVDSDQSLNKNGWAALTLPNEGVIAITTPTRLDGTDVEYIYNIAVDGWGLWRDVPINCLDTWGQSPYVGTIDGRVLVMDVSKDDVRINPVVGEQNGENIQFSIMFSYTNLGKGGLFKRGVMARPDFVGKGNVSSEAKFFYDYDLDEILTTPQDAGGVAFGWDISNWDEGFWNTSKNTLSTSIQGGSGMGRSVTLAIKGNTVADTILASVDVFFNTGGGL